MKKKLNRQQEEEILFIKQWCITIIDFIYLKQNTPSSIIDIYKSAFDEETQNRFLEKATPSLYLKGLREAFRDTNEMANSLSKKDMSELNFILDHKFRKNLTTHSLDSFRKINKIIRRGKINDENEFRIIHDRVNEIYQTKLESTELNKLNKLMSSFERNKSTSAPS